MPVKKGRIGPREELIAIAGILVAAAFAWYLILYNPVNSQAEQLNVEFVNLQDSLNADTNYKAKTTALQVQITKLEGNISDWDARFPSRKQIVSLTKQIISFFKDTGLDVVEVSPSLFELYALEKAGARVAGQYVMQLPLHFTLHGRFLDIGKMLENLESLPFNMTIADIDISANKAIYPQVEGKFGLYLYVHL